jgi:acyl-CoA reductase-like NAD-dependent aldehyde dehydrogenase
MQSYKMLIDGKWVDSETGQTFKVVNPATEEEIAEVPLGGKAEVDKAVAAAAKAFPMWSGKSQDERSKILLKFATEVEKYLTELAQIEMLDHGSPISITNNIVNSIPHQFEYAAEICIELMGVGETRPSPTSLASLQREPIGVCALITPWNVPIMVTAKIAPALAAGNTCVIKPPSVDSLSAIRLLEIMAEYFPPGVVNLVTGPGGTVGETLAGHPGVHMVAFTGSCETGQAIMAAASKTTKRLFLELGGKNPFIVLEDADLDSAVAKGVHATTFNSGMICSSPGRYYIHESLYDEFIEKYIAGMKKVVVGNPANAKTQMGPVVSAEHRDRVEGYIKIGLEEGAKLVLGGKRPTEPPLNKGYYVMPTVLTGVTQNMTIAREEIFGPVACIMKFSSESEVLELANDNTFGLAASVWTRNTAKGVKFANAIQAGTVYINRHGGGMGSELPWGGFKESGFGKERSLMGQEEFTQVKVICLDTTL